jgi:hypothetical protein
MVNYFSEINKVYTSNIPTSSNNEGKPFNIGNSSNKRAKFQSPGISTLPEEVIKYIGSWLTPNEVLVARLVDKRFAKLYFDPYIWKGFFQTVGLKQPSMSIESNSPVFLVRNFFRWNTLQQMIESKISKLKDAKDQCFFCISILTNPEFSPLHGSIIKSLIKVRAIPKNLTADKLILNVARGGDTRFAEETFNDFHLESREKAIKSLTNRWEEPEVQDALINLLSDGFYANSAAEALKPHVKNDKVKTALLTAIDKVRLYNLKPLLDIMIGNPELLNKVVYSKNKSYKAISDTFNRKNYLENPTCVDELICILKTTKPFELQSYFMNALLDVADQEKVQQAICESLVLHLENQNFSYYIQLSNSQLYFRTI